MRMLVRRNLTNEIEQDSIPGKDVIVCHMCIMFRT